MNLVEAILDVGEAARIVFNITFVTTDAGGDIFQAVDGLGKALLVLFEGFVEADQFIEAAQGGTQLVKGRFEIIAADITTFKNSVDEVAQFTEAFCVAQDFAFLFQFLDFAGLEVSLLDFINFKTEKFGAASLIAFVALEVLECFTGVAPCSNFGTELVTQGQQFGVAIKEVDVLFGTEQAHMFALSMDINEPAGDLLQNLLGEGATVDACNGAT